MCGNCNGCSEKCSHAGVRQPSKLVKICIDHDNGQHNNYGGIVIFMVCGKEMCYLCNESKRSYFYPEVSICRTERNRKEER